MAPVNTGSKFSNWIKNREALSVLLAGFFLTALAVYWAHIRLEDEERTLLLEYEQKVVERLEDHIATYQSLLMQTKSFLELNPSMTAVTFRQYFHDIDFEALYPGLPYVGFIRTNLDEGRFDNARIAYAEPYQALSLDAADFNLALDPIRKNAMLEAALSGEAIATSSLNTLPELRGRTGRGFVVYLPVFDNKLGPPSMSSLAGFVFSPFEIGNFAESILSSFRTIPIPVLFEIVKEDPSGSERVVFSSILGNGADAVSGSPHSHLVGSDLIEFGGQKWRVKVAGVQSFSKLASLRIPATLVLIGGLLSFLVFMLVRAERGFSAILEEKVEEIKKITDSIPILIGYISTDEHFVFLNQAHHSWFKTPVDKVFNKPIRRIMGDDQYEDFQPYLVRALAGEKVSYSGRFKSLREGERFFQSTLVPDRQRDGRVRGVFFSAHDTTENVLFTERIRQSEERLQLIAQATNDVVWEWDLDEDMLTWNEQIELRFGYKMDEVSPQLRWWIDRIHQDDVVRTMDIINTARRNRQKQWQVEYRFIKADGTYAYVIDRGTLLEKRPGHPAKMVGAMMDITELRSAQEALKTAKDQAELANNAKTAFLANMSHEIRTPLGAIIGFTDLCLEEDGSAEEKKLWLTKVKRNSVHLLSLIDEILDISKVESGRLEVETSGFSLEALLKDVHSLLVGQARAREIELNIRICGEVPEFINSDQKRLKQVLINLVGNSIKFTSEGHVELMVSTRNSDSQPQLVFQIQDTGVGLTSEQSQKLFTPFSQADSSISRKFGGTGLGLALSRRLSQKLGGDVRLVHSTPGQGSLFEASIALITDPGVSKISKIDLNERLDKVAPHYISEKFSLLGLRILLVEDSPDNQLLMSRILRQSGAILEIAHDGKEGIEKGLKNTYDAILMDIQMPHVDGYTATRTLRSAGITTPILALTAHAFEQERAQCYEAGCDDHLTKPVDRAELIRKIRLKTGRESYPVKDLEAHPPQAPLH